MNRIRSDPTGPRCGRGRGRARGEAGQSLAEFALIVPLLLVLLLGLVEFTETAGTMHALTALSREGANLAARGVPLDSVVAVVERTGSDLSFETRGGTVVSRVEVRDGVPVVTAQRSAGEGPFSRLGTVGSVALELIDAGFREGSTHFAVEVFYAYEAVTPLYALLGDAAPRALYERSVF